MVLNVILKFVVIAEVFLVIEILAYKYVITARDEEIYSRCDMANTNFIDKYFDFSNMKVNYLENGSVHCYGEWVVTEDFGTEDNPISIQTYKKNRDSWISTVFNMNRNDVCKQLYDKTELWFPYIKDTPEEERKCPFLKGKKLNFDIVADMEMDLPDPRLAGEYKIQLLVTMTEAKEVACANILADVYRK